MNGTWLSGGTLTVMAKMTGMNGTQLRAVIGKDARHFLHEIMHILLNQGHRNFEPSTALFYSPTSQFKTSAGKKRIGPYPQSKTNNVGDDDTTTMRANAETLP